MKRYLVIERSLKGLIPLLLVVSLLSVALLLSSCAALQRFSTDTLNSQTGDQATLALVVKDDKGGALFDPGGSPALGVRLDVQADELTFYDATVCEPYDYGVTCNLGDVQEPEFVRLSGKGISATATYRRVGSNRIYQELAIVE